jgi:hypothetical protein
MTVGHSSASTSLVLLALVAAGCSNGALILDAGSGMDAGAHSDAGAAPAADARAAAVDGRGDAAPGTEDVPSVAADGPVALPFPDAAPSAGEVGFLALIAEQDEALHARWSECFGVPADQLAFPSPYDELSVELEQSLRRGLVRLDEAAGAACLTALRAASCEQIAAMLARGGLSDAEVGVPACQHLLVGQVAPGEPCLTPRDCRSPEGFTCGYARACQQVCTALEPSPRLAVNGRCGPGTKGICPEGTQCRLAPEIAKDTTVCARPAQAGGFCEGSSGCMLGLGCVLRAADAIDGICRANGPGTSCAGTWECAAGYACVGATDGRPGVCRIGRRVGDSCVLIGLDVNQQPYSDCALWLSCLDLDGEGLHCMGDGHPGDVCGEVQLPAGALRGCFDGFCDRGEQRRGRCQGHKPPGATCTAPDQCPIGGDCVSVASGQPRTCLTTDGRSLDAGGACHFSIPACPRGNYCAPPADFDAGGASPPRDGTCVPLRRIGETCRPYLDDCELLAGCIDGVCRRC